MKMVETFVLRPCLAALAVACGAAAAQGGATFAPAASAAAASAPINPRPGPRPMSPAEMRDAAAPTADQRPEGQVTPQLSIPFGKAATGPLKLPTRAAKNAPSASANHIDEGAARCEAASEAQLRTSCRETLERGKR
jgi:hypothetical protein